MARWHRWEWVSARSFLVDGGWRSALAGLLAREECMHDAQSAADTVFIDDNEQTAPGPVPGWSILPLGAAAPAPAGAAA
jgi:hypothetical protein